jgi:hypothetical protein
MQDGAAVHRAAAGVAVDVTTLRAPLLAHRSTRCLGRGGVHRAIAQDDPVDRPRALLRHEALGDVARDRLRLAP